MSIDLNKQHKYILVGVRFYTKGKIYEYLSDTDSYSHGEIVYVEGSDGEIKEVTVDSVRKVSEEEFPVPIHRMKYIFHKKYEGDSPTRNTKSNTQPVVFESNLPSDSTYQKKLNVAPKITKTTDFNGGFYSSYNDEPLQELYKLIGSDALEYIKKLFYNMYFADDERIKSLLDRYEQLYGWKARNYIEDAIQLWSTNHRRMSGQTAARIFDLLPRILNTAERISVLRIIIKHVDLSKLGNFHSSYDLSKPNVLDNIKDEFNKSEKACQTKDMNIPKDLAKAAEWLCDNDSVLARSLVCEELYHEQMLIIQTARRDLDLLPSVINAKTRSVNQEIVLPDRKITVYYTAPSKGPCFVATVTYRNSHHPDVEYLRQFRDIYLKKSNLGRNFIELYYSYGPYLAKIVDNNPMLRKISFYFLSNLVKLFRKHFPTNLE